MYDPDRYDLDAALASAKTAPKRKPEDEQVEAERAYLRRFAAGELARPTSYGLGHPTTGRQEAAVYAVTAEDFHRHAQRFGSECVAETAKAFGGQLTVAAPRSTAKRYRRTSPNLRLQVVALRDRGVVPAAIADTLNVSDERVRKILKAAA